MCFKVLKLNTIFINQFSEYAYILNRKAKINTLPALTYKDMKYSDKTWFKFLDEITKLEYFYSNISFFIHI